MNITSILSFASLIWMSFTKSQFVNIQCNYTSKFLPDFKEIPVCEVVNNLELKVENVPINIMNPNSGFINGKYVEYFVKSFVAQNKEVHYLPTLLGTKLPDLIEIIINHSKLKGISSNSLEKFKLLCFLDLRWNEIIVLQSNLFKNNEELKFIWLSYNRIQYIDPAAFDDIHNLSLLDLTNNVCYSFNSTTVEHLENIQTKSFCSLQLVEILKKLQIFIPTNRSLIQLPDQIKQSLSSSMKSEILECKDNLPGHNLAPSIIICALLFVIIILIQLIICCKHSQNDSEKFKDESQELKEIIKNDSSGYIDDSSTYEEITYTNALLMRNFPFGKNRLMMLKELKDKLKDSDQLSNVYGFLFVNEIGSAADNPSLVLLIRNVKKFKKALNVNVINARNFFVLRMNDYAVEVTELNNAGYSLAYLMNDGHLHRSIQINKLMMFDNKEGLDVFSMVKMLDCIIESNELLSIVSTRSKIFLALVTDEAEEETLKALIVNFRTDFNLRCCEEKLILVKKNLKDEFGSKAAVARNNLKILSHVTTIQNNHFIVYHSLKSFNKLKLKLKTTAETTIISDEEIYSEVADYTGNELEIKGDNSVEMDETYSVTYESNRH